MQTSFLSIKEKFQALADKIWARESPMANAITILKDQHQEFNKLFQEIEMRLLKNNLGEAFYAIDILKQKILLHTELEEDYFYPAAHRFKRVTADECLEEHKLVNLELETLNPTAMADLSSLAILAKVRVICNLLKKHIEEEETVLFPACRRELTRDALHQLGLKMQRKENEANEPTTRSIGHQAKRKESPKRRSINKALQKKH